MHLQRAAERTPIPWKNGRGVQYEIVTVDDESGAMRWRLSTADLATDAPFSEFPGVHREFCLATGDGVSLTIDGVEHTCAVGSITRFDGGSTTSMRLWGGPCRAVNLMRSTRHASPRLEVCVSGSAVASAIAVVAFGEGTIVVLGGERFTLGTLDAVVADHARALVVEAGTAVACVVE